MRAQEDNVHRTRERMLRVVKAVPGMLVKGGLVLLVLGSRGAHVKGVAIPSYAGKYLVYAETFYTCEGEYPWSWNIRTSHYNPAKPNEVQRLTGFMNGTQFPLNDTLWLNVVMDKRSNNMWKENAFVFRFPTSFCSVVRKQIPDFYHVVFRRPRNENTPCSVPPKIYSLNDDPVAWVFPSVPIMPYGAYRFRLSGGLPTLKSPVVCLIVEGHIVPKL